MVWRPLLTQGGRGAYHNELEQRMEKVEANAAAPPRRVAVRGGARRLEVWRTGDGRVLLHQPGRGHEQDWIEVLPEAIGWLAAAAELVAIQKLAS